MRWDYWLPAIFPSAQSSTFPAKLAGPVATGTAMSVVVAEAAVVVVARF
jgi:hypothetical protein